MTVAEKAGLPGPAFFIVHDESKSAFGK